MAKAMAQKFTVAVMVLVFVTLMAPPAVEAQQDGILSGLLNVGLLNIGGKLYCTLNGGIGVNGTATPVFPNALVQLKCGSGNIVSTATTNANGVFGILLNPLQILLSTLLQDCKLVVPTPLSTCNSSLPAGGVLVSLLQIVENILIGLLNIVQVMPSGFNFTRVL